MTPAELLARLEKQMDRVPGLVDQGREEAIRAMARVKAPGHLVYRDGSRIRVVGPRGRAVARELAQRGSQAAAARIKGAL